MTRATSFTSGDEIKNEKVTPSGMPDSTKPMKSGQAEHEQNEDRSPEAGAAQRSLERLAPHVGVRSMAARNRT